MPAASTNPISNFRLVAVTFWLTVIAVSLTGCVAVYSQAGGHIDAYEGPARSESEVAVLVSTVERVYPFAWISKIDDFTTGDDYLRGFPRVVRVLPGAHRVTLKCTVQGRYAYPSVVAKFEKGNYYEGKCKDLGNGFASALIVEHGTKNIVPAARGMQ